MIRVGIIGATGYAGGELVRILLNHKDAKIVWYGSRSYIDKKYYQVYQNMFQLVAEKATSLYERVEVLSRRSIRDKLMCYFSLMAAKNRSGESLLPFSLSALADYISTDRSAMMRELKRLKEEGVLRSEGRRITLCTG